MSDKFVTVATFNQSFEAQLARNLLENEGITSIVGGEFASDALFGNPALGDQIVLQVREEDAQRAAGILAAVAAAKLDEHWEDEAEAGVWLCSICGEPISNRLSVCYSCQTPREGIRAGSPRDPTAIQSEPALSPTGEEVLKRDDSVCPPALSARTETASALETEDEEEETPLALADDLARHAFGAAFFGLLTILLLPLSWYYLIKLMSVPDLLSPKGRRYLYGALFLNGFFLLLVLCVAWLL